MVGGEDALGNPEERNRPTFAAAVRGSGGTLGEGGRRACYRGASRAIFAGNSTLVLGELWEAARLRARAERDGRRAQDVRHARGGGGVSLRWVTLVLTHGFGTCDPPPAPQAAPTPAARAPTRRLWWRGLLL